MINLIIIISLNGFEPIAFDLSSQHSNHWVKDLSVTYK